MTLIDALAAALRDRLLAGHAASLPGVGTLQRERVTARVERQTDGSSLLLPPSETVGFVPSAPPTDDALAARLLKHLGTPSADATDTLRQAIDQLEAHLAASGTVRLPSIGAMHRSEAGLSFEADPSLLTAVAQPYEGMAPVSAQVSESAAPTDASFIDEETLDDDLDDVLATPLEASDPGGLRAVLPLPPVADTPQPPAETIASEPEAERASLPEEGIPLAAAALVTAPDADATTRPSDSPSRSDAPESPSPDTPAVSELTTPPAAAPPEINTASDTREPSDLGWLDDYDADDTENDTEAAVGATLAGAAASATAKPRASHAPHLPKPPPVIAGPVEPAPKRGIPVWLWMLVPLLVLALLFFWYRSTQAEDPTEPILTAELAPDDASDRVAQDTLTAATPAVADSAELALADVAFEDTSAASPLEDAAALDGEFPVEELTGPDASSTPAPAPTTSRPTPPPARSTPSATRTAIDRPDLSGLSDADREALTGTAPIVSGRGGFSWVVLSTRDRDPADFRARQYRNAGWRVRVFQTEALGDTVYRVAVGQFASRDQADRLRTFLPSQVPTDTWRLDLSTL
ncbi:MAG: hypothetical protein Rubg2KO_32620 [Rubricoccaceae bacterium]